MAKKKGKYANTSKSGKTTARNMDPKNRDGGASGSVKISKMFKPKGDNTPSAPSGNRKRVRK